MTQGLQRIATAFAGYEDSYVIIGGTACSIIMDDNGLEFRATKDVDMVLIAEGDDAAFARTLWDFIRDGGYSFIAANSTKPHFYRFDHPQAPGFPTMIELFSRHPDFTIDEASAVTPIHISDDVSSLSAIMLDDSYYRLLQDGREILNGVSVLNERYLIPFKAKAWLDLDARHEAGEHVDAKNLKKHQYDVFRLTQLLAPSDRIELEDEPRTDMAEFLRHMKTRQLPLKQIGVLGKQSELIDLLESVYQLR
ncbi:hypothetical protein [Bifidobacterium parmae]|uniref:Nucleotidyl transferase AbiEii/AbiGii toxin family protein n=1 Tax=Bifidobacterium parmae TaxID=361854 RepID=A0A2N5J3R9_9BIFI|nr:hypothetical protein [Bifidobacterium parmae]PLS28871.1 hypothetical protein Uis4E_1014 [Bifidobacterium parmae]